MTIEQSAMYLEMSKALNISRDRYEHINSYITRMTRDYKGDVVDIVKEIPLNLKGKERYFAMFIIGRTTSQLFSDIDDELKEEFIIDITDALKISAEMADLIISDIDNKVLKDKREDKVSTIDIMKQVTDGDLKDTEKDYMSFLLGLIYF